MKIKRLFQDMQVAQQPPLPKYIRLLVLSLAPKLYLKVEGRGVYIVYKDADYMTSYDSLEEVIDEQIRIHRKALKDGITNLFEMPNNLLTSTPMMSAKGSKDACNTQDVLSACVDISSTEMFVFSLRKADHLVVTDCYNGYAKYEFPLSLVVVPTVTA